MNEVCDVCGEEIVRDYYRASSGPPVVAERLGVCGCANRQWRWRSETGVPPWELIGTVA